MSRKDEAEAIGTASGTGFSINARGRKIPAHDGSACDLCGITGRFPGETFPTAGAYNMHRNWHVRKGHARWSTDHKHLLPTAEGKRQYASFLGNGAPILEPGVIEPGIQMIDKRGYKIKSHTGTPCELCGATGKAPGEVFPTLGAFATHRNWHVRNGEARWNPDKSRLIPTTSGKKKYSEYLASANTPATVEKPVVQEIVINSEEEQLPPDRSPEILKTLTQALLVVQIATAVQDMAPGHVMQVLDSLKQLSNLPSMRRR